MLSGYQPTVHGWGQGFPSRTRGSVSISVVSALSLALELTLAQALAEHFDSPPLLVLRIEERRGPPPTHTHAHGWGAPLPI